MAKPESYANVPKTVFNRRRNEKALLFRNGEIKFLKKDNRKLPLIWVIFPRTEVAKVQMKEVSKRSSTTPVLRVVNVP